MSVRSASGMSATQLVDWTNAEGDTVKVPPNAKAALEAKYRGQSNLGEKALCVLGFFNEKAFLKATVRKFGDTAPHDPLNLTAKANVATVLSLKADPSKKWTCGYGTILSTRFLEHVLKCEKISDDDKLALCAKMGKSGAAQKWKEGYDDRHKIASSSSPAKKLSAAELEALTPAERNARKRQQSLSERTVQALSAAQIEAIHFALCTFFFICHIPFSVIENWAFVAFVSALSPAYAPKLFKRIALSTNWLGKLYDETQEKIESKLHIAMGKQTVIIDGFKDVRK